MATQDIRAKLSYLSVSAQKTRLVVDLVRGKDAVEALEMLRFVQKRSAEPIRKLVAWCPFRIRKPDIQPFE